MKYLVITCLLISSCSSTKDLSDAESAARKQSKRFAQKLFVDKDVQDEYASYFEDPKYDDSERLVNKAILLKWYAKNIHCKPKSVKFLETKKLKPEWRTYVYRVKSICGDNIFAVTYEFKGKELVPFTVFTTSYEDYPNSWINTTLLN
jgi:hypothetical protein